MRTWRERTSHEKVSLGVFVVLGTATLLFSIFRFQKSVLLPFVHPTGTFKSSEDLERERTDKLKTDDTDKDGVKDYDELYIYRTSPFLEDSDSDGINDGIEISQGYDPNCPKGQTCRQQRTTSGAATGSPAPTTGAPTIGGSPSTGTAATTAAAASITPDKVLEAITETFGDPDKLTPESIKSQITAMSSAELRAFLTKLGVPDDVLKKTDDPTLRSLLEETLKEISAASP
ncbi:hypothetical protein HY633_02925 [Candidatus Uhrbacteria bacterium]|nr:hypothetical protein [Candidatus Uhrbacteria bacterium]